MGENKEITSKQLKIGQQIAGYRCDGYVHIGTAYVKEINAASVTVTKFGADERIPSEATFFIPLSREEIRMKYNAEAGKMVKAVQNCLYKDEIGYKEMWNGWSSTDPWTLAMNCRQKNLTVIGFSTDITPKIAMLSGDALDAALCVEDSNGERFWCHVRSSDLEAMLTKYENGQEGKDPKGQQAF